MAEDKQVLCASFRQPQMDTCRSETFASPTAKRAMASCSVDGLHRQQWLTEVRVQVPTPPDIREAYRVNPCHSNANIWYGPRQPAMHMGVLPMYLSS